MRIPSRRILLCLALCWEEVSRWWSHKVLSGCVRFPRKSIHIFNFFLPQMAVGVTDGKFVENNETSRHGGMYSIASFETSILTLYRKKPFMVYKIFQMNYNWNTKEYCTLDCFFYLKYGSVFLHLGSLHLITPKILRSFLIVLPELGQRNGSPKTILISFQLLVHDLVK